MDLGEPYSMGWATGWRYALAYAAWGGLLFALRGRVEPLNEEAEAGNLTHV